jgi:ATP synthase protein I
MSTITPRHVDPASADESDEGLDPDFKPLTAEEARHWREKNPPASPWRILGIQSVVGLLVTLLAWLLTGKASVAWSAAYGALAVVIPAALFARGLLRQQLAAGAGAALAGFFVWEMVKIALTVAMLFAAPRLISQLSWLALLAGFVVTMKVYWVAMWLRPGHKESVDRI